MLKLNNISTLSLNNGLRTSTLQKQVELNKAQYEVATGRMAEIGRQLGAFSSSLVSLQSQIDLIDQTKVTNSFAANRLETMQLGINTIVESSNTFVGQLSPQLNGNLNRELLETLGQTAMANLATSMNVTIKGEYVFSGVNSDVPSLVEYDGADGAPAKAAVQAAFTTHFGFGPNDPLAAGITATDLETFLDGPFMDLFDDANWETLWSGSSERSTKTRISAREIMETPTTGHNQAFREVAAGAVMIAEFSNSNLNLESAQQLAETAITTIAESTSKLANEQAKIGVAEERVENANDRMDFQKEILVGQLSGITDVDAYEAALRLNQLSTSLEASYSATARIQSLSLLNFL